MMDMDMQIPASTKNLVSIGDVSNYLSIALNLLVTMAVILDLPLTETFDDTWRQCYTSHFGWDTSTICCIILCASTAGILWFWNRNRTRGVGVGGRYEMNQQLSDRLPKIS